MKVRVVEITMKPRSVGLSTATHPPGEKRVIFWCAGCGCFHSVAERMWNGDTENPTINPHQGGLFRETEDKTRYFVFSRGCHCHVDEGVVHWGEKSAHRLAGKSLPLQHEEAWRDGGHGWDQVRAPDDSQPHMEPANENETDKA